VTRSQAAIAIVFAGGALITGLLALAWEQIRDRLPGMNRA
jgi:hypothetical protein